MSKPRFTVVYDSDVQQLLNEWTAIDLTLSRDRDAFDHDLASAPRSASQHKASGYYVGRRGCIVLKYAVSDGDQLVRVIGAQYCSHPFYVDLSRPVTAWLRSIEGTLKGDLALSVVNQHLPALSRDPRLVGVRIQRDEYRVKAGRVTLDFQVIDADCHVCVTKIEGLEQ